MCTFTNSQNTYNTQSMTLNKNITVSNLKNNLLACYWYDRTQSYKQDDFNCGAIQFESEAILTEFKRTIADCQLKMKSFDTKEAINLSLSWVPPDSLSYSGDLNLLQENLHNPNNIKLEFERQITFNLNSIINYSCASLNLYSINSSTPSNFFIISIELDKNIFFKHYIRRDQKFDLK